MVPGLIITRSSTAVREHISAPFPSSAIKPLLCHEFSRVLGFALPNPVCSSDSLPALCWQPSDKHKGTSLTTAARKGGLRDGWPPSLVSRAAYEVPGSHTRPAVN